MSNVGLPIGDEQEDLKRYGMIPIPMRNATGVLPQTPQPVQAPALSTVMPKEQQQAPPISTGAHALPTLEVKGKEPSVGRVGGIPGTIDPNTNQYVQQNPNMSGVASLWSKAENIHNPFLRVLGEIGAGAARGLDTIGNIVSPRLMERIPGTTENKKEQIAEQREEENRQSKVGLEKAQTKHAEAEAETALHPAPEPVYDQGVPVSIKRGNQTFPVGDPNMPPELKPLADAMQKAYDTHKQTAIDIATGKPDTATQAEQDMEKLRVKAANGQATAEELAQISAHEAEKNVGKIDNEEAATYKRWLADNGVDDTAQNRLNFHQQWNHKENPTAGDARADRSYTLQSSRLLKLREPITALAARMGRLDESLAQGTPQADALVAPELLSIMSGGAGSGLRMNEAEIARVVGGRSNWESLKASAQKWALDPKSARSITPEQQREIRALVDAVKGKLTKKQALLDDADEQLIRTDDIKAQREIVVQANKGMSAIDAEGSEAAKKPWEKAAESQKKQESK